MKKFILPFAVALFISTTFISCEAEELEVDEQATEKICSINSAGELVCVDPDENEEG